MTEHEQWLNSLEVGSKVAYRNRPIGGFISREMGWRIYVIAHITPKRNRFDLTSQSGDVSLRGSDTWDLKPVTSEILESIARDNNRIHARKTATALVATLRATIDNSPDILNEPEIYALMAHLWRSLPQAKGLTP